MLKHVPFFSSLLRKPLNGTKPKHTHVLVYGAIEVHEMGPRGCVASNKTISEEVGLAETTVANLISELSSGGWIKVNMRSGRRESIKPLFEPSLPNEPHVHQPVKQGSPTSEAHYIDTERDTDINIKAVAKAKPGVELKNNSSDINALLLYFFSRLVPAEQTSKRFSPTNRKAMDALITTYTIPVVRETIDKAKELLGVPYKPQVQTIASLLAKFEQIKPKQFTKSTAIRL